MLNSVPLLAELQLYERELLLDQFVERTYENNETIIEEGETGDQSFFIVQSGHVAVSKEVAPSGRYCAGDEGDVESPSRRAVKEQIALATLGPGEYFGEMALLKAGERGSVARQATVRSCGRAVCLVLTRDVFDRMIRPLERLRTEMVTREADNENREEQQLHFEDLELGNVLGVGSFGYVRIAVHRGSGKVLALKAMKKKHIVKKRQVGRPTWPPRSRHAPHTFHPTPACRPPHPLRPVLATAAFPPARSQCQYLASPGAAHGQRAVGGSGARPPIPPHAALYVPGRGAPVHADGGAYGRRALHAALRQGHL